MLSWSMWLAALWLLHEWHQCASFSIKVPRCRCAIFWRCTRSRPPYELNWSTLENGELLATAEAAGFDVFLTTDKNLKYQQNLASRSIAIVVLGTTSWPRIKAAVESVAAAVDAAERGTYEEVVVP